MMPSKTKKQSRIRLVTSLLLFLFLIQDSRLSYAVENNTPVLANYAQSVDNMVAEKITLSPQHITLIEGRSHLLKFSNGINRISVSNPQVLDFLTLSPHEVMINAKQYGSVNLFVWDANNSIASFDINVTRDPGLLEQLLKEIDGQGHFEIFPSKDVFVVKGETSSVKKMKVLQEAVENFSRGSVSLVRVKAVKQILLKTRFIQIDHTKDRDFGIDFQRAEDSKKSTFLHALMPGQTNADYSDDATNGRATITGGANKPTLSFPTLEKSQEDVYSFVYTSNSKWFEGAIKAAEAKGITKTIARPNLLAKDGEEASFLVGGETPVVVSTANNVSIQYKEFGTRLTFKPEIMEDGEIMMTIEPEVSTLSDANGVDVGDARVKGFATTKVKTVVQLKNGETLLLGGLIQQQLETTDDGVPYLRNIPVLGKLFESYSQTWHETELIVIVTPRIVDPEVERLDHKKDDVLSAATALIPSRTESDKQLNAVKYYIKENNRWKSAEEVEKDLALITDDVQEKREEKKKAVHHKSKVTETVVDFPKTVTPKNVQEHETSSSGSDYFDDGNVTTPPQGEDNSFLSANDSAESLNSEPVWPARSLTEPKSKERNTLRL